MKLGISGTDENKRIIQAQAGLGIAGEVKGKSQAGAMFGISGNKALQYAAPAFACALQMRLPEEFLKVSIQGGLVALKPEQAVMVEE